MADILRESDQTLSVKQLLLSLLCIPWIASSQEGRFNGFDVFDASVSTDEIIGGGVPRDGIEALTNPKTTATDAAELLDYPDQSEVLSYTAGNGETRGYPIAILRMHEAINDVVGGEPIVVTYCPLCKTGMVFSSVLEGATGPLSFGVSGLLYNSDVLLYDRETESLWSQLGRAAISGKMKGTELEWLPSSQMRIGDWVDDNPEASLVSIHTGKEINYRRFIYASYHNGGVPIFSYHENRDDLPEFSIVQGIVIDGQAVAVKPRAFSTEPYQVEVGSKTVAISYDAEKRSFAATSEAGELLPSVECYWFAWQAFHPETKVIVSKNG